MNNSTFIDPAAVDLPPTQSIDIIALVPLDRVAGTANVSTDGGELMKPLLLLRSPVSA
jgi:hypothetical protein